MIKCQTFPTLEQIKIENPNLKALLFDMDGTLLKSEFVHAMALQKLLLKYNETSPSIELLESQYVGIADYDVIVELQSLKLLPADESIVSMIEKKNNLFISSLRNFKKEDYIQKEVVSLLVQARQENFKLAVVTASENEATHAILNYLNLSSFFDLIITAGECENTKPHPEPYLKALKAFSLSARDVVILEDSNTGIQSAMQVAPANIYKAEWYLS